MILIKPLFFYYISNSTFTGQRRGGALRLLLLAHQFLELLGSLARSDAPVTLRRNLGHLLDVPLGATGRGGI